MMGESNSFSDVVESTFEQILGTAHVSPPNSFGSVPLFTPSQVTHYLERIGLSPLEVLSEKSKSVSFLEKLEKAHIFNVPYDNSDMHLRKTVERGRRVVFGEGEGPSIALESMYERVVVQGKGAYCFVLNMLFSTLLRSLGFSVSEVLCRNYAHQNKDPTEKGWDWGTSQHQVLIVRALPSPPSTAEDSHIELMDYFVDVSVAGDFPPSPIPLIHGHRVPTLLPSDTFIIRNESLQGADDLFLPHRPKGTSWILYRQFNEGTREHPTPFECPTAHFHAISVPWKDWETHNFNESKNPRASMNSILLLVKAYPDGRRLTLLATKMKEDKAVVYWRKGKDKMDVEVVDLSEDSMELALHKHFSYPL
ncbi:cysteine proteinase [Atractiella rhizophila]|nr:cysteine proteinase [Atractiella rhizophila]